MLLRELLACCRVFHIYPSTHSRVGAQVERVLAQCEELLDAGGPLEVAVAGAHLQVEGIDFEGDVARTLSTRLKMRGLRGVMLRPGISPEGVRGLVALLAFDDGDPRRDAILAEADSSLRTECVEPLPWVGTGIWVHGAAGATMESLPPGGDSLTPVVGGDEGRSQGEAGGSADVAAPSILEPVASEAAVPARPTRDRLEALLADTDEPREEKPERVFQIDVPDANELLGEADLQAILEEGAGDLEERFATHSPERLALRILFRLLVLAPNEEHYHIRRDTFLRTLATPERLFDDLVRVLGRLLQDGSLWRFEPAPGFAASVLDSVESVATRVRLFTSLPFRVEHAQQTLQRWATKPDALATLSRVLAARVAPEVAAEASSLLAQEVRRDPGGGEEWFRRDRRAALHPRVLHTLVTEAPQEASPLCRRILERGPSALVRRVAHLLATHRSDDALRLLTESLPKRRRGTRADLIRAVARFPQPQAILALRGILQQNNDRDMHAGEVELAATGLNVHELSAGREALWNIAENRTAVAYRRPLRAIVEAVLQGDPA